MHNLKEVRKDFESFKKSLENRSVYIDYLKLENLDKKNREFIQIKENLEKEKKEISKSKDKSLFEKSKKISKEIEDIVEKQNKVKLELDHILSDIPNIPHKDVPIGKDENDNVETFLEWDLKNHRNIPVSSGIYLIHINDKKGNERTIKWFGIMRPQDLDSF